MATVRHATPPLMAIAVLVLVGLFAALPSLWSTEDRARADAPAVRFGLYLRRMDGRSADPVNVIFTGERHATAAGLHVARALRWTAVPGSDMAFTDHGVTRWAELQLGTGPRGGLRRHLRLAGSQGESERWGMYTLAAVHHDIEVPCGHLGAGFDEERDALAAAMEAVGYRVTWLWLGNDGPVEHCDGSRTHGDGWAAVIELSPNEPARAAPSPSPSPSPLPSLSPSPNAGTPSSHSTTPTPSATPSPSPSAATPSSSSATSTPSAMPTPSAAPAPTPSPTPELPRDLLDTPLDR